MSFPRYPEYRDSGVEWLGEVPAHWIVIPLGRVATARCDGPFGSGLKTDHYTDEGARVIRLQNIRFGEFDDSDAAFIDLEYALSELAGHDVLPGDVLIAGLGDERNVVGRTCVAPAGLGAALVKADCFRFRLDQARAEPNFVALQLSAGADAEGGRLATGTTRQRIALSATSARRLALPPVGEQTTIARFLDRETAKIGALIAEQERLIELLKEKRQAVISHAVTKGLDPDAPMKDSGVEWLGEVPAHWSVIRLGFLTTRIGSGKTPLGGAETYTDSGVLFIRSQNVYDEGLRLDEVAFISEEVDEEMAWSRVRPGDILLNITGASLGRTCLVPDALPKANVNQHVCVIRLSEPGLRNFVSAAMKSASTKAQIDATQNGAAREGLNFDQISKLWIALPPVRDKERISAHIETVAATTDALIFEAGHAVELLRERRAALISATVTGQIDVRSAVGEAV